jgi:hypothetical protein
MKNGRRPQKNEMEDDLKKGGKWKTTSKKKWKTTNKNGRKPKKNGRGSKKYMKKT